MGDKDPGKKDADAKEKKKKRHALIKELQKQIDEQAKQIESLKLRLQNQLKDSIKIQTANRQMRRLWLSLIGYMPPENVNNINIEYVAAIAYTLAGQGRIDNLRAMIENGSEIVHGNTDGRTPLHASSRAGQYDCAEFLISQGCDLQARDRWGSTPFKDAVEARHGHVALLLERASSIRERQSLSLDLQKADYVPLGAELGAEPEISPRDSPTIGAGRSQPNTPKEVDQMLATNQRIRGLVTRALGESTSSSTTASGEYSDLTASTDSLVSPRRISLANSGQVSQSALTNQQQSSPKPKIADQSKLNPLKSISRFFGRSRPADNAAEEEASSPSTLPKDSKLPPRLAKLKAQFTGAAPSGPFGLAPSSHRGPCQIPECRCQSYIDSSGVCVFCGHGSAMHNLPPKSEVPAEVTVKAIDESKIKIVVPKEPGKEWPKVLNPDVEHDETWEVGQALKQEKSSWIIDSSHLLFTAEIGHGSSATVFKGLYKGQTVAIKVISFKPSKKLSRDKQIRDLREEFNIMSVLQSKHIIFFHGLVVEPRLCMILELCEQGSLYDVLNISADEAISNNTPAAQLDWPTLFHWFTQAVNGVEALHSWKPPIVHRDVKTLNLLINSQNEVKVADFGLSRFLESDQTLSTLGRLRGTYAYCAPEVYYGEQYTTKADMYSLGIILWELVNRLIGGRYERPYAEYPYIHFDFQIVIQAAKKGTRPSIPRGCPQPVADLIAQLWSRNPNERPDTQRLLEQIKQLIHQYTTNKEQWDAVMNSTAPLSDDEDDDDNKSPRDPKKARRTLSKDKQDKKKVANTTKDKRRN